MKKTYVDTWWEPKLKQSYDLQPKHKAALSLIRETDFPLVDLGAGNGVFLKAIEEKFPDKSCYGVELSHLAVSQKICQSPIEEGNIIEWEPGHQEVRTATLIDVLEHLDDPSLLLRQVANYASIAIIACPNFNFLQARIDMLLGKIPFQNKPARGGHVYWCQYDSLLKLFAECNFRVMAEQHLYPQHHNPWIRKIGKLRPPLFAHEFIFLLSRRN